MNKVSLLRSALYAKCLYYLVLYTYRVSLLFGDAFVFCCAVRRLVRERAVVSAQRHRRHHRVGARRRRGRCVCATFPLCTCSLLLSALHAKSPYYLVLYIQSVLIV